MATASDAVTIDLTLDDTPPPRQRSSRASTRQLPPPPEPRAAWVPTGRDVEVIDISDSDEPAEPAEPAHYVPALRRFPTPPGPYRAPSPDIEIISERHAPPAPAAPAAQPARQNGPIQPPIPQAPAEDADRPSLRDFLSRGVRQVIGNLNNAGINFLVQRPGLQPEAIPQVAVPGPIEFNAFDGLQFDYEQPAFQMGPRESEPPNLNAEPYKAPPAAKEGFTRDVEEEEILLCSFCKDELAAGESELKQQVWVIKQCGHVS